ncbi:MAG TPA: M48 family metalloprotease [Bacteroidales bacterium]|nr:M48 family metalloprotease [Bacteroidales bacterium]HPS63142.1 M48 family metalloprotease [Bacteroidales bacterium]
MKTTAKITGWLAILIFSLFFSACKKDGGTFPLTIFTVEDDIALGKQVDQEIMGNPSEYPILDSVQNPVAYQHLYRIRNQILAGGKLTHAADFTWKCRIIRNDTVINAFCVPGGNMYFYTGIIKLLDNEAQFAGVMAHEMAHADLRHTSEMLTIQYGESLLLSLILGSNPSQLAELAAALAQGLGNLAYSRSHEYEADAAAVRYLYPTQYDAASLGDFFTKLQGQSTLPAFLSTHPSPEDRLAKINETFNSLGGVHGQLFPDTYLQFKSSLP